jgi:D-glycero-alpha-D-manno-heptose-7-phosphate kinase
MTIVRSRAPLRLGLAGGGSDVSPYCDIYGGAVLNATIDLSAYCTLAEGDNGDVTFIAADRGDVFREAAVARFDYGGVLDLHKGVYNRVVQEFNEGRPLPVRVTTFSDTPPGSGLGSSSTMVVAMLTAFAEYLRLPLGEYDIARISFEIERQDIGLRGGGQDQYAATFGGVNFLEFYEDNRVIVNPLRIKNWILDELEVSTVLYFTGVSRESDRIISEQIKNYRAKDETTLEAVHRLKIDASRMKEALLRGEIRQVASILGRSWEAKRRVAHNIGNEVIETALSRAMAAGAHAGKVSGAGGGGFMMLMCDPVYRVQLIQALSELPGRVVNFHFVSEGAHAWRTSASTM